MDDVTDRELILAAFELGVIYGRKAEVGNYLHEHGIPFTTEMVKTLMNQQFIYTGYEPFNPITELKVPSEVHAKLLAGRPSILIIAQLSMLTKEDLAEDYGLTHDEVEQVKTAFEFGFWRLLPSIPPSSD
jgi:hypothetical protein